MAHRLYGRHANRHRRQPNLPPEMRPPSSHQIGPIRSVPQTREVRFRTKTHRIPRSHLTTWNYPHGSDQNARSSRLAPTNHRNRRPFILRLYGVLPILHSKLLQNRKTSPTINKERHCLGMGTRAKTSLRTPQNLDVSTPSTRPTKLQQTVRCTYRRFGLWRGRHTLTGVRNAPKRQNFETVTPPHSLLLSHVHPSRKKLRHLRERTPSRSQGIKTLETSSWRIPLPVHSRHGPRQPRILERTARPQSPNSEMAWILTRLLVRYPTHAA